MPKPKPKIKFWQARYDCWWPHYDGWWIMRVSLGDRWIQFMRPTTDECYDAWLERERADPYILA